jgi:hypothetical protein
MNRRRFSLKYPDGRVERFGCCNPQEDDNRDIVGTHFLVHKDKRGPEYPDIGQTKLPEGTLWTNGYYDKEHDGWKPLSEWK